MGIYGVLNLVWGVWEEVIVGLNLEGWGNINKKE